MRAPAPLSLGAFAVADAYTPLAVYVRHTRFLWCVPLGVVPSTPPPHASYDSLPLNPNVGKGGLEALDLCVGGWRWGVLPVPGVMQKVPRWHATLKFGKKSTLDVAVMQLTRIRARLSLCAAL